MLILRARERSLLARVRVDRLPTGLCSTVHVALGLKAPRLIIATLGSFIRILAADQVLQNHITLVHFSGAHALVRFTDILTLLSLDHAVAVEALRVLIALIKVIEHVGATVQIHQIGCSLSLVAHVKVLALRH